MTTDLSHKLTHKTGCLLDAQNTKPDHNYTLTRTFFTVASTLLTRLSQHFIYTYQI